MKRRQAAVVFNDISGYTSLMQRNEDYAIQVRQRHKEVVDRLTLQHKGTIIQYYGDGTLSIFDHAVDAVQCAMSMQIEFNVAPQIPLRIGINAGDIILGPDGIYGDSVNIASRIERMSVPGSVLISERVFEEIKDDKNIQTKDLGLFELKNVRTPMQIHAVTNEGIRVPDLVDLAGKIGYKEKTIMVLPFYNLSKDPEDDFLSDGMTEQIIYALSEIEGLRVTSRTSSFTFKDKQVHLRQLHQDLGIDHVLEGSIRRHGKKVRITAQLINAADDFHLWSEIYTREVTDVFQLEDEISSMISNKLKASYQEFPEQQIMIPDQEPNAQSEVYEYYHKGRYEWKQMQAGYIDRAIQCFKKAIVADPDFYLTWPALGKAYAYKGYFNQELPEEAARHCLEAICEAQRIEPAHSRTQTVCALYHLFFTWDWRAVKIHLDSTGKNQDQDNFILYNSVLHATGIFRIAKNNLDDAVVTLRKAQKLDPLNLAIQMELARAYLYNRDYQKALDTVNLIIHTRPDFLPAYESKGWIQFTSGQQREGIESFEYYRNHTALPLAGLAGLSYAYARTSQARQAVELKELLISVAQDMPSHLIYLDLAIAHLGAQEYPAMFEQLQKALDAKMPKLIFLETDPIWDEIRRFKEYRDIADQIFKTEYDY
ncbi:MAG TPA: adenylate/guanylate cyclase domain-containing protein [Saprospiraceae bacterium]|nr:adenylate/guanylate cyclase domain-containing protein [Saprospiraceae bacterium]